MNLRNGLMRVLWYCAPVLVTGLFCPAMPRAEDSFQPPRTVYQQPTNGRPTFEQPSVDQPRIGQQQREQQSSTSSTPNGNYPQSFPSSQFPQSHSTQYGNVGRQSEREPVNDTRSNEQRSSHEQLIATTAEEPPSGTASMSESRPIGGAHKQSGESATASSDQKLTLVSPGKLFTAVMFVVFLILLTAKFWKKHIPGASIPIPAESLTVLGERKLNKNHSICLVRLGSRVLVLGSSADGLRTLAEITDPVEIDFLSGMARSSQPESVFTSALGSFMKKTGAAAGLSAKSSVTTPRTTTRTTEVPRA